MASYGEANPSGANTQERACCAAYNAETSNKSVAFNACRIRLSSAWIFSSENAGVFMMISSACLTSSSPLPFSYVA